MVGSQLYRGGIQLALPNLCVVISTLVLMLLRLGHTTNPALSSSPFTRSNHDSAEDSQEETSASFNRGQISQLVSSLGQKWTVAAFMTSGGNHPISPLIAKFATVYGRPRKFPHLRYYWNKSKICIYTFDVMDNSLCNHYELILPVQCFTLKCATTTGLLLLKKYVVLFLLQVWISAQTLFWEGKFGKTYLSLWISSPCTS